MCQAAALSRPVLLSVLASSSSCRTSTRAVQDDQRRQHQQGVGRAERGHRARGERAHRQRGELQHRVVAVADTWRNVARLRLGPAEHDRRDDQRHVHHGVGDHAGQQRGQPADAAERVRPAAEGDHRRRGLHGQHHGGRAEQHPVQRYLVASATPAGTCSRR